MTLSKEDSELQVNLDTLFEEDESWRSLDSRLYDPAMLIPKLVDFIKARDEARDSEIEELLKERDSLEERLDSLAEAVAVYFKIDIGEHSSANDPWYNAFQLLRDNTRQQLTTPSSKQKEEFKEK